MKILILDSGLPDHIDIPITNKFKNFFSEEYLDLFQNEKYFVPDKGEINYEIEPIDDFFDHQTNMTGIICSNKIGFCKNVDIYVGKILNKYGYGTLKQILEGLKYANEINPNIINISTGYDLKSINNKNNLTIHNLIKKEIDILCSKNIAIICAAGNKNKNMFYPANFQNTISASIYYNSFKNSDYICKVEHFITLSKKKDYTIKKGSSSAAAYLTSLVANYLIENPKSNINKIKNYIKYNNNKFFNKYEDTIIEAII
jgi:subtilisin family serine protease